MKLVRLTVGTLILTAALAGGGAYAQGTDSIIDLLVRKGVVTEREAKELKAEADADLARAMNRANKTKVASWLDALQFTGDLRLRGEYFNFEDDIKFNAAGKSVQSDRLRFRYRFRFGAEAQYQNWATVNFRLASGDGDPVSVNQSLTDTFRKKPVMIDVASVTITPPGMDWLKVIGGKMDLPTWQPKFNSPMVYDTDVTPEGVAEQLQWTFGEAKKFKLFAQAGQYAVKEVSADANDAYMFDQGAGFEWKVGDAKTPAFKLTGMGGYYFTDNIGLLKSGDSPNKGNALIGTSNTTNNLADFGVFYARAEAAWRVCDKPFLGTPAVFTVSGEYNVNVADGFDKLTKASAGVHSNDLHQTTGWTGQIAFGETRKKGQWQVAYQYKHQQADSTWDAITDSDWGNGGTDRKGHIVKAVYCPQDWWQLGFAAIITEKISDRLNTGHNTVGIAGQDQLRVQVDSVFKF